MLELKIENDEIVKIDQDTENAIRNQEHLSSVFNGTAYVSYDEDETIKFEHHRYNFTNMLFDIEPNEDPNDLYHETYKQIVSAKFYLSETTESFYGSYFVKSPFKKFVQDIMNNEGEESATWCYDLITNGCVTGMVSELIYHNQIIDCIKEHKNELEAIIQNIADNTGEMGFPFGEHNSDNFSFDKIVWIAFEETVRTTLRELDMEDV